MGEPRRFRAFISYSQHDRSIARALHRALERYALPRSFPRREGAAWDGRHPLRPIFLDNDELVPGMDLPEKIRTALLASDFLIVICSPNATSSAWVNREIELFVRECGHDQVLPIVIAGEPHAQRAGLPPSAEALPEALRGPAIEDAAKPGPEPLWVDWRNDARRDRSNFLRVIAGLLQLQSLDDLLQRDRAQSRRRRTIKFAGAAGAILAMAGLWMLSLNSETAQAWRFDAYFKRHIGELTSDDPDRISMIPDYQVDLVEDLNGDRIMDFVVVNETFGFYGTSGMSNEVYVGNAMGGFEPVGEFHAGPWKLSTTEGYSRWKLINQANPGGDFIKRYAFDPGGNAYDVVDYIVCKDAVQICFERTSQFCAIENAMDIEFDESSQFTLRGRQNEYSFDEAYLEPAKEIGRWGGAVVGISFDGKWALVESFRSEGGSFIRTASLSGSKPKPSSRCVPLPPNAYE